MSIKITSAKTSHAKDSAELLLEAMEDLIYFYIGVNDKQKAINFLEEQFKSETSLYSYKNSFVALINQKVVGILVGYDGKKHKKLQENLVLHLSENYSFKGQLNPETREGEFYIDALSVNHNYRGQKIGSQLISFAEQYAQKNQIKNIGLLVDEENPAAKRLYSRLGFNYTHMVNLDTHAYEHLQKSL
ncbi:GNAT family N-acetyltransferase [Psychroflexus halocasei]|uniref:Acetyltransferase (GNAT) family protein n=1 Tax=Psychroflexus halocasei TaxID=908615 RepID=A0A1H4ANF9_9FLAO|nr:GNAT family N-acetyltransferase [Psychroflexus halocasei]SEA37433.1 Acetyltransferase (GNAT) family protein [Psychroflexus halocasei]